MHKAKEEPTVLIIGAGTFGASTAYHLSKQYSDPSRITLIDRWSLDASNQDKHAAAIDTNRIIRTDYSSRMYCNLANEAIHFWFWSIAVQGHFHKTGWKVLESDRGEFGDAVRKAFKERGGDYTRDIELDELKQYDVLKGLKSEEFAKCYFNPEAGWCDAEKATTSFTKVALERGVRRVTGEVEELLLDAQKSRLEGVRLNDGRILNADKVVVAAGAWTSSLLSSTEDDLEIRDEDRIERQITAVGRLSAYYTLDERETQGMIEAKMPVIVLGRLADIIPPSHPNRTLKINDLRTEITNTVQTPSGHRITVPSRRHQNEVPKRLREASEQIIRHAMTEWTRGRIPDRWRLCYDAVTPTEDWLMCRHPDARLMNLYVAVGGSFHSYKFLPNAGAYMCNVLEGKSNGEEKDGAWKWKTEEELKQRKGKEFGASSRNLIRRELSDYEDEPRFSRL
ncbi:fructosyl amino acid oxidasesarcosine oxidase [Lophiotrema nucula]|uniref:Fructosyl amino acid oxidasesarcosine oxidase n=1 Tax=Lophiotrema nucula TaxID=690887 RepID=A0A6A5ZU88_9PLEO|nr:fructosyl amino acid oxidasesarcosine oxidase [Lophiotrema nucula]